MLELLYVDSHEQTCHDFSGPHGFYYIRTVWFCIQFDPLLNHKQVVLVTKQHRNTLPDHDQLMS